MGSLRSRGFSIIDLLSGLVAGAILLMLAVPTALRVQAKARNVDCKDRLKTIAQAVHDFHDGTMRLPPGTLNYSMPIHGLDAALDTPGLSQEECQNISSLLLVLPFTHLDVGLDRKKIFKMVDTRLLEMKKDLRTITDQSIPPLRIFESQYCYGPGAGANWPEGSNILGLFDPMRPDNVASMTIPTFLCPEDRLNAETELPSIVVTMPYFNGKSAHDTPLDDVLYVASRDMELARTNYVAIAGTTSCLNVPSPLSKWAGGMTGRQIVTLEMVSNLDGTANTFMYGETLGDVGGIMAVDESGRLVGMGDMDFASGKRSITRAWIWGGLATLAAYNFPWGEMEHPDAQDPETKTHLKLLGDGRLADPGTLSSVHEEGVNFAMLDASVHTVPRTIKWQLYYGNGGLRDGMTERGF